MKNRYLWIDLETTGLYNVNQMEGCKTHKILEVALHITDDEFNIIDDGYVQTVNITDDDIYLMNEYVLNMHTQTGLIDQCKKSEKSLSVVEDEIITYLDFYGIEDNIVLCGNTIHFDKIFIEAQMPRLAKKLNYRVIDVSSLKEIAKLYNLEIYTLAHHDKFLTDDIQHRALVDIEASIRELKIYLTHMLRKGTCLHIQE